MPQLVCLIALYQRVGLGTGCFYPKCPQLKSGSGVEVLKLQRWGEFIQEILRNSPDRKSQISWLPPKVEILPLSSLYVGIGDSLKFTFSCCCLSLLALLLPFMLKDSEISAFGGDPCVDEHLQM